MQAIIAVFDSVDEVLAEILVKSQLFGQRRHLRGTPY